MDDLRIQPFSRPFNVSMSPPGSKSLTNRALVLATMAAGDSTLGNVLFADDTLVMLECLMKLGFHVDIDRAARTVRVEGRGGAIPSASCDLFCGNSGTTLRFLAGMCALGHGRFNLDGIPRMRQRPVGQLGQMLKNLGVRLRYVMEDGFPPIEIMADALPGGILQFHSGQSSQFLSAVLMASPYARNEVQVTLVGKQTSWPYVAMTMRMMDVFNHTPHVIRDSSGDPRQIIVPQGGYSATDYQIEPDASNASYFLAAAAIHPGAKITIEGLGKGSLQGDVGFADILHRMGADLLFGGDFITIIGPERLQGIDVDLLDMPDVAQTLAVTALFADGPSTLRGLHTLRHKETDRLAALAAELAKLGAEVDIEDDALTITPPESIDPAAIDTYDDHRMAMSFALAGTKAPGIVIKDPNCVNKTYPEYWQDLAKLRP